MRKPKKKYHSLLVFLAFIGISMLIHRSFINEFPHHIHSWAHCDHYALSKGFVNNGMDFSHPETFVYNKQFQNADGTERNSKTIAVDFPINNYVVAAFMKLFNTDAPIVFRIYTLLISCIGLAYLFLIAYHYSGNYLISFLLPLIVVFTPIYLDYQVGFLPSSVSLSFYFIGSYYFIAFLHDRLKKQFIVACALFSLAALIRTPYAIFIIATGAWLFLDTLKTKRLVFINWFAVFVALALPALYFLYNAHLRTLYGSVFLSSPKPVESWEQLTAIVEIAHDIWRKHYFNDLQYLLIYLFVIITLTKLFLSKISWRNSITQIFAWQMIAFLGVLCYVLLMIPQFTHHDYYFLDTFYPVLFVVLLTQLSVIDHKKISTTLYSTLLLVFCVFSVLKTTSVLDGRRNQDPADYYLRMYQSYSHASGLLQDNQIPKDEKLLIIDAFSPNMPFILTGYSGYSLIYRDSSHIAEALSWDAEYVMVQNFFFTNELLKTYPEIIQKTEFIDSKGGLLLLKKTNDTTSKTLLQFIKIASDQPKLKLIQEQTPANAYYDEESNSCVTSNEEFAYTYNLKLPTSSYQLAHVKVAITQCSEDKDIFLVIKVENEGQAVLYLDYNLRSIDKNSDGTRSIDTEIILPKSDQIQEFSAYFYNPNQGRVSFENLEINFY